MKASSLKGVFVPLVTPFARSGEAQPLDVAGFQRNVRAALAGPARGLVLFGSTGEFVALTEREKHLLVDEACAQRSEAGRPLIAGVGNEGCEADLLALARYARRAGCDAVMVLPPHYYPQHRSESAVTSFFLRVAEASPLPVIMYSMPKCVDFEVADATVAAVSRHENVIGIKDSSGDAATVRRLLVHQRPGRFAVLTGSAAGLLEHAALGAEGAILAVANVAAGLCARVLGERRPEDQRRVAALHAALQDCSGGQIALLKAALAAQGLAGGDCRDPLPRAAAPEEVQRMLASLRQLELV